MRKTPSKKSNIVIVDDDSEKSGPTAQTQFYLIDVLYAVTFNPCDTHQFILKPDRKTKIKSLYREILETCNCKYHLKLEFSEPRGMRTKDFFGPRLHFHGVIKFTNKEQLHDFLFKTYHLLCKYGTVDIDLVNDPSKWYEYIYKQKVIKDKIHNFDFIKAPQEITEVDEELSESQLRSEAKAGLSKGTIQL